MVNDILADKKIPFGVLIKRSFKYVASEKLSLFISFILIIINVFFTIVTPVIVGQFTDHISSDNIVLSTILLIAGATLAISLITLIEYFKNSPQNETV